jgi:hypothetical protein
LGVLFTLVDKSESKDPVSGKASIPYRVAVAELNGLEVRSVPDFFVKTARYDGQLPQYLHRTFACFGKGHV